jgi:2-isopropylmalate synthase
MRQISIYDTTLRDGTQAEEINLNLDDKLKIAIKLDHLGVHYIEGGWPGSNPTDKAFFKEIRNFAFKHATIAAFGATHHPKYSPAADPNLKALIEAKAPAITIFGKSWDLHVKQVLRVDNQRNLDIVRDSLAFLRSHCQDLFFDAEHFFDGFKANPEYALAVLDSAVQGGADVLVLCDTNGKSSLSSAAEVIRIAAKTVPLENLGVHFFSLNEVVQVEFHGVLQ